MKNNYYSKFNILNVYSKKSIKSKLATQILYGEKFKILSKKGKWWKIKLHNDNYKGFILKKKFNQKFNPTHKIFILKAKIYKYPNPSIILKNKLSFNSRIEKLEEKNNFIKFEKNKWIKKNDVKKIEYVDKNILKRVKIFLKVKYKWGGKSFKGIDCSALLQLFFNFNNKFCFRDTIDQISYFKKSKKKNNIDKFDLIFWKGHIAIMLSKKKLIHAYGPLKKLLIMNYDYTLKRILKTANLKVLAIKKIS